MEIVDQSVSYLKGGNRITVVTAHPAPKLVTLARVTVSGMNINAVGGISLLQPAINSASIVLRRVSTNIEAGFDLWLIDRDATTFDIVGFNASVLSVVPPMTDSVKIYGYDANRNLQIGVRNTLYASSFLFTFIVF